MNNNKVLNMDAVSYSKDIFQRVMQEIIMISEEVQGNIRNAIDEIEMLPPEAKDNSVAQGLWDSGNNLRGSVDNLGERTYIVNQKLEKALSAFPQADASSAMYGKQVLDLINTVENNIKSLSDLIGEGGAGISSLGFVSKLSEIKSKNQQDLANAKNMLKFIGEFLLGGVNPCDYGLDPINLNTGNFFYEKEDIAIPGRFGFAFKRTYNSTSVSKGILGNGWNHNYEIYVNEHNGLIRITLADGKIIEFKERDNLYTPVSDGVYDKLLKTEFGFQLKFKSGDAYAFNKDGKIKSIIDRNGNILHLAYEDGNLASISSTAGRLELFYEAEKIKSITDSTGRRIEYKYDGENLISYIDVEGQEYKYNYDKNNRLEKLINIFGNTVLKNVYDENGKTLEQELIDDNIASIIYDDKGKSSTVLETNGNKVVYKRDDKFRSIGVKYLDGEDVKTYDKYGNISSYKDKNGNITSYQYDAMGNLLKVTNAFKECIEISYENNRPILIKNPNDSEINLNYDENGNLIESTNPLNIKSTFAYNAFGLAEKIINADKSEITFEYDNKGNVTKIQDELGAITEYQYDELNRVIAIKNPKGNSTEFKYDVKNNITKVINQLGQTREYFYTKNGKLNKVIDFDNGEVVYSYNLFNKIENIKDKGGYETRISYDNMRNVEKVVYPNERELSYEYDLLGRVVEVKDNEAITKYKYDPNGNVISLLSPRGFVKTLKYDALNRAIEISDFEGNITKYEYDVMGNIKNMIDALENTVKYEYDLADRLIKIENQEGNFTEFSYDVMGRIVEVKSPNGGITSYEYYVGGRLKNVIMPEGETESYEYDLTGNLTSKMIGNSIKTEFYYDVLERLVKIKNPNASERCFEYDLSGNISKVTDENGNVNQYKYDIMGNLIEVINPYENSTQYEYDASQNLTRVERIREIDEELSKAIGHNEKFKEIELIKYTRNKNGQVVKDEDVNGNSIKYEYDNAGNLDKKIDKDGSITKFYYNPNDMIEKVEYSDNKEVLMEYDELKKLKQITDWLGTTKIQNDALGRVKKVENYNGQIVEYGYNNLGQKSEIVYPDGTSVKYEYNGSGKLAKVIEPKGKSIDYSYDTIGRLIEKSFPNGYKTKFDYNEVNQITRLANLREKEVLDKFEYKYDDFGNQIHMDKFRNGNDIDELNFEYDRLHRLTGVKGVDVERIYGYDSTGNRVFQNNNGESTTYAYNSLNQLLEQKIGNEVKNFSYDMRGNLSSVLNNGEIEKTYNFDPRNLLTKVNSKLGEVNYDYNGFGKRVKKSSQLIDNPMEEINYILDLTRDYNNVLLEGNKKVISANELLGYNVDDENMYFMKDGLMSTMSVVDQRGNLIESLDYDEFGIPKECEFKNTSLGFTGYDYDKISGDYFAQARFYDSSVGRFLGEDMVKGNVVNLLGLNRYTYCYNKPSEFIDQNGKWPSWSDLGNFITEHIININHITETTVSGDYGIGYEETTVTTETAKSPLISLNWGNKWGVYVNLPSVETPVGNFGFDGTRVGVNVGTDGLTIEAEVGIEAFSYGINGHLTANALSNLNNFWNNGELLSINGQIGGHKGDQEYGVGLQLGLADTKAFVYSNRQDGILETNVETGIKPPKWSPVLLLAAAGCVGLIITGIGASEGAGGLATIISLLFGTTVYAAESECE